MCKEIKEIGIKTFNEFRTEGNYDNVYSVTKQIIFKKRKDKKKNLTKIGTQKYFLFLFNKIKKKINNFYQCFFTLNIHM